MALTILLLYFKEKIGQTFSWYFKLQVTCIAW